MPSWAMALLAVVLLLGGFVHLRILSQPTPVADEPTNGEDSPDEPLSAEEIALLMNIGSYPGVDGMGYPSPWMLG